VSDVRPFYAHSLFVREPACDQSLLGALKRAGWNLVHAPIYRSGAREVMRRTGLLKGKLLELGCSSGYQLREFSRHGEFDLVGVDIDRSATRHAKGVLGLDVLEGELAELGFKPEAFDVIILFNVFEHLREPRVVVAEIFRLLKPGGWIAIKTHRNDSLQARTFGRRWQVLEEAPRHMVIPSRAGLEGLLMRAGFGDCVVTPGPFIESVISMALSVNRRSTERLAESGDNRIASMLLRFSGILTAAALVPFGCLERIVGKSGTTLYISQKPMASSRVLRTVERNLSSVQRRST